MGNLCGKESSDNFTSTGRTVNSAQPAAQPAKQSLPARAQVTGPGRTVGGASAASIGGNTGAGGGGMNAGAVSLEDPRAAAARAAEERANKLQGQNRGKLGEQLAAQRKQTRGDALEQASAQTRGARAQDENAANRSWN